uniref:GB1/RHD3-type G domain-containing protein n=1 Tax=Latimeria chalumnae TaxID=7897 RepID=H3ALK3_LATCH
GFSLGSTVKSHTKGIWMWCLPHPCKPDHCLVIIDTEGLGDVKKGDQKNDHWLFALSILMSSMLIYNSMKIIDHNALSDLHLVTELLDLIKVRTWQEERREDYEKFPPKFVWATRDFDLELEIGGKKVIDDGYLESALQSETGNMHYFKYIHTHTHTVHIHVVIYTHDHVQTHVHTNTTPIETHTYSTYSVYTMHTNSCKHTHVASLLILYIKFPIGNPESNPLVPIGKRSSSLLVHNNDIDSAASYTASSVVAYIASFFLSLVSQDNYPFSHTHTHTHKHAHAHNVHSRPPPGVKASNVLFDFKVKKVSEVKILLQMDECLTQKEKEITAEKEKAAIAEQRNRAQEEQVLQIQKQLEDTEKSNKENTEKLLQKMEEERKRMMEENKLLLEEKLQDQERYLKKGFHDIAQAMQKEIKSLKIQVEQ